MQQDITVCDPVGTVCMHGGGHAETGRSWYVFADGLGMSCERRDSRTPKFWTGKHPELAEKIWNSLGLSFQLHGGLED